MNKIVNFLRLHPANLVRYHRHPAANQIKFFFFKFKKLKKFLNFLFLPGVHFGIQTNFTFGILVVVYRPNGHGPPIALCRRRRRRLPAN